MRRFRYPILLLVLVLTGCPFYGYKYPFGELPEEVVNLEAFNSEYDDYNSTAPILGRLIPFCFSTNRDSEGEEFDIRYDPMNIEFSKTSGDLNVFNDYGPWHSYGEGFAMLVYALSEVNTAANELGPYLLFDRYYESEVASFVLMYASDEGGDFDVLFTYNEGEREFFDSQPVAFLNSEFNDLYPSFNADFSEIYFCSDREEEVYNIFQVSVELGDGVLVEALSDQSPHEIHKNTILSSEYDDKCPYVFDSTLVFTSNRPGGYGGYDLYYSRLTEGEWGDPVNFGPTINSEYDEYRPILFEEDVDDNRDMMVFSSNRPEGEGGFDLYYVGIPE
jgi:hypothetical protein